MSRFFKSAAFPILIVVVLAFFVQKLVSPHSSEPVPSYGDFITQLDAGQVKTVNIKTKDNTLVVKPRTGAQYERGFLPDNAPSLESRLEKAKADHKIDDYNIEGTKSNGWLSLLTYVLPFLIFIGFWIFLMNQVQGGGSKVMSFGKSRAKRMSVDSPKITFRDVAGVDEAV
ncbi:MAG TPA: ATP-dependent metallopeptidase FtsH/Yme1/Tma family protein, partial [Solirubrobacteraceae bacterium]